MGDNDVIKQVDKLVEINPSTYNGCYQLIQEVVLSYKKINLSSADFKDLDLIYMTVVGTWQSSVDHKKKLIEQSNLLSDDKEKIKNLLSDIWIKSERGYYSHREHGKPSIGMFGTGFFTTSSKTNNESVKNWLNLFVEVIECNDEDKAFSLVENATKGDVKGLGVASLSVILHCLKPTMFPIINSHPGNVNVYDKLGIKISRRNELDAYIENAKRIRDFRNKNSSIKNYRVLDEIGNKTNPYESGIIGAVEDYKKYFDEIHYRELYKWEAVKQFQDNWDPDTQNFCEMLERSLAKSSNLLSSGYYFAKNMILKICQNDSYFTKELFLSLFDENVSLNVRIENFINDVESFMLEHEPDIKGNSYQDIHAISVYLTLKYPEKYYFYKRTIFENFAKNIGYTSVPKRGKKQSIKSYLNYIELLDEVNEYVISDDDLISLHKTLHSDKHYSEINYKIFTMTIVYFNANKNQYLSDYWKPSEDEYHPGLTVSDWVTLLDDGKIFNDRAIKLIERMDELGGEATCTELSDKFGESANYYNSNAVALAKRVYEKMNVPLFTGDDNSKWWPILFVGKKTIADQNGYWIWKIRSELREAMKLNNKNNDTQQNYWWLVANPKIWSFNHIKVNQVIDYSLYNENNNKRRIFQNFLDADKGDFVIGYESTPNKKIVALCKISEKNNGEKLFFEKIENLVNPIDFEEIKSIEELKEFEFLKNQQGSLFRLTESEYGVLLDLVREKNPRERKMSLPRYTKENFLSDVYISEGEYDLLKSLLLNKKNIILQGAPGVGKTYAAKRLAYSILREKDESKIESVQFHQNYSYEDFVMGYKPTNDGFELRDGTFYKFCKKAENDSESKYFFIIDEINRGNLSKVFGELLMLIEKDYRNTAIKLAYDGVLFSVPENVYIIGMMNTADRSLAMIDYALRRRFSFYEFKPGFDSAGFKNYMKDLNSDLFDSLINKVKKLNTEIVNDESLGEGFQLGHSYFCNLERIDEIWIAEVIDYEILPTLKEYWFDDKEKVQKWEQEFRSVLGD